MNSPEGEGESSPRFLPLLVYVLGFMVVMALLALLFVWLIRLF
jgi:hypothetical protein